MDAAEKTATGIVLQILATFLAALAYIWQKQAHLFHSPSDPGPATSTLRWRAGFGLMVFVAVLDIYCFSLLNQSVLGAFGAVTLAWNIVLARVLLHEALTRLMLGAVLLISLGTILAVSASGESQAFTLAEILVLADRPGVYGYLIANIALIGAGAWTVERAAAAQARGGGGGEGPPSLRVFSVLSPMLGGMCMGLTGYGAKAVSTAVFTSDWAAFGRAPIWGFLALTSGALYLQVRYLNKGLEFCDAVRVVPVFQASIILANSLGGIIFYEDLVHESAGMKVLYGFGAALAVSGVCALLMRDKESAGGGGAGGGAGGAHDDAGFRALAGAAEFAATAEGGGGGGGAAAFAGAGDQAAAAGETDSPLLRGGRPCAPSKLGFIPWPEA